MMQEDFNQPRQTLSPAIADAVNYNQWVISLFLNYFKKSILEIGVGHGNFYSFLSNHVDSYVGVDIDENLINQARQMNPGQKYYYGDLSSVNFSQHLKNKKFDGVLCLNVLEHIEDDELAIHNMLNVLEPNGYLMLFVPAFPALYTDLDKLAGHCRRYTKKTLCTLIPSNKGEVVRLEYFNPIGGIGWWLNKRLSHKSLNTNLVNKQIKFFDQYVLPVSRLFNYVTRSFFGQSLVCVVRKK